MVFLSGDKSNINSNSGSIFGKTILKESTSFNNNTSSKLVTINNTAFTFSSYGIDINNIIYAELQIKCVCNMSNSGSEASSVYYQLHSSNPAINSSNEVFGVGKYNYDEDYSFIQTYKYTQSDPISNNFINIILKYTASYYYLDFNAVTGSYLVYVIYKE